MTFVKGFELNGEVFLEGEIVTLVLVDGEAIENVTLSTASAKKIGVKVEDETFERVFETKEVALIKK
jgi:hypothetical protein